VQKTWTNSVCGTEEYINARSHTLFNNCKKKKEVESFLKLRKWDFEYNVKDQW